MISLLKYKVSNNIDEVTSTDISTRVILRMVEWLGTRRVLETKIPKISGKPETLCKEFEHGMMVNFNKSLFSINHLQNRIFINIIADCIY